MEKNRSFLTKCIDKIFSPIYDMPAEVREEIKYMSKNVRGIEEWKQPFIKFSNELKKRGLEEISRYILNEIIPNCQKSLLVKQTQ